MAEKKTEKQDRLSFIFAATAVALVVFMLMFIPTNPMRKYKSSVEDLEYARQEFETTVMLRDAHIERLRDQEILMERLNDRAQSFQLWSFLNLVLTEQDLKNRTRRLENYRDRSGERSDQITMVEWEVDGLTLEELANVLHRVYSSNNLVVVYKMTLRAARSNRGLECTLVFLSPSQGAMG